MTNIRINSKDCADEEDLVTTLGSVDKAQG